MNPGTTLSHAAAKPRWFSPAGFVRARFQRWLQQRLPRTDTLLLTQGNVYILPTRAGLMFGLTLLVLLIASINYQLNLGYAVSYTHLTLPTIYSV